jgi:hypothetical protein
LEIRRLCVQQHRVIDEPRGLLPADVKDAEQYLVSQPQRLAFLLHDQPNIEDPERALDVLRREHLSPLIRSLALLSLLLDLIEGKRLKFHGQVLTLLDQQANEDLEFAYFERLWNEDKLNRLDFYTSDLDRMLRVGDVLPIPHKSFWPELKTRWDKIRTMFSQSIDAVRYQKGTAVSCRWVRSSG